MNPTPTSLTSRFTRRAAATSTVDLGPTRDEVSPMIPLPAAGWLLCAIALLLPANIALAAPVRLHDEPPVRMTSVAPGVTLIDFGRVAFGNLRFSPPTGAGGTLTFHFGEAMRNGRVDRQPPGTVRYAAVSVPITSSTPLVVAPAANARNTRQVAPGAKPDQFGHIAPSAVLTPASWGVVLPFRWVEIEGATGELTPESLRRQSAFAANWDDTAAAFHASDPVYNRIWELCRYSIKATTFAGVYVDGDRERIPYEADAYLNQLSHYATDHDAQFARDTYDHLMANPTWPTEWATHLIFMAHADWMQWGDRAWLATRYEALKSKLLLERVRDDGLITSTPAQIRKGDLVDWPAGERDGFVFTPVNTVANAFFIRGLALMGELAHALGHEADAAAFAAHERRARAAFQAKLFDPVRGVYRDGEGTEHAALHSSLFPLAFGLVPEAERARVTTFVASRGMACSVYAAQYLLEALFENDAADAAHALITAAGDRSWRHMVESGTTITWEAWDQRYKPNQDWNHAWGAAPANLFPRYVLGVQPTAPGWDRVRIKPHPGPLRAASGKIPSPRGAVEVEWVDSGTFRLSVTLPPGTSAEIALPAGNGSRGVWTGERRVPARRLADRWIVTDLAAGTHVLEVQ
jgi:alpha-L-rhamnosidase